MTMNLSEIYDSEFLVITKLIDHFPREGIHSNNKLGFHISISLL